MSEPTSPPRTWEKAFLAALALTGNVSKACVVAKIARSEVYEHRGTDKRFKALWRKALDEYSDVLEAEVHRRGEKGWLEPVFQGGKKVGTIRKYSDALLLAALRAKKPEYRETVRNEHAGDQDNPLRILVEYVTEAPDANGKN